MKTLAFALLLAQQVWVSPVEQSYGPYLAPAVGGEPALVASANGVLLAWSEFHPVTRRVVVRTGILDFDGRLVSDIASLPTWGARAEAIAPMVATDGEGFAVAWFESSRVSAIALDANGNPVAQPLTFGFAQSLLPLLWNGTSYQLADRAWTGTGFETRAYAFDRHGAPAAPRAGIPEFPRFAASGAQIGLLWASTPREYRCGIANTGCAWFDEQFIVDWEVVRGGQSVRAQKTFRYYSKTNLVAAGDGGAFAAVWRSPDSMTGLRVVDGAFDSTFTIDADAEPDGIAFDGQRWLVVFTRDGDVWGAFVDRQSRDFAPFPIATKARIESKARATALAPGRFLVSYASDLGPDDHRFAGRIVLADAKGKRRAIR